MTASRCVARLAAGARSCLVGTNNKTLTTAATTVSLSIACTTRLIRTTRTNRTISASRTPDFFMAFTRAIAATATARRTTTRSLR